MLANQNETKNVLIEEISLWTDRSIILRYQSTSRIVCVVGYASSAYLSGTPAREILSPFIVCKFVVKIFSSVIQEDRIKLVELTVGVHFTENSS